MKTYGRVRESATLPGSGTVTVESADIPYGPHVWIQARDGAPCLDVAGAEATIAALGAFVAESRPRLALSIGEVEVLAAAADPAAALLAAEVRRLRTVLDGEAKIAERGGLELAARRMRRALVPVEAGALRAEAATLAAEAPALPLVRDRREDAFPLSMPDPLVLALHASGRWLWRFVLNVPAYASLASEARRAAELSAPRRVQVAAEVLEALERRARVPAELAEALRRALGASATETGRDRPSMPGRAE